MTYSSKLKSDAQERIIYTDLGRKTENRKSMSIMEEEQLLKSVKNIVAVSSGKGGVGKSTVAANLAVSLAKMGNKVGLLDADISGPSIPKMFGIEDARPVSRQVNRKQLVEPVTCMGIKILSIGFFVDPDKALVWRGPMVSNAIKQLVSEADWGELDYFVIDLPPGTSDTHLTLVQQLTVTGTIVVSTPQQVALADARKNLDMFSNDKIRVPILGLVENMAWFTPAELPGNKYKYYIFGKEGCKRLAKERNIPLLAQIPLIQSICESGDAGMPVSSNSDSVTAKAFMSLAENVVLECKKQKS